MRHVVTLSAGHYCPQSDAWPRHRHLLTTWARFRGDVAPELCAKLPEDVQWATSAVAVAEFAEKMRVQSIVGGAPSDIPPPGAGLANYELLDIHPKSVAGVLREAASSQRASATPHDARAPLLPLSQWARIGLGVGAALQHLARHNTVHLGLRPGDVMIDSDGSAVVAGLHAVVRTEADSGGVAAAPVDAVLGNSGTDKVRVWCAGRWRQVPHVRSP